MSTAPENGETTPSDAQPPVTKSPDTKPPVTRVAPASELPAGRRWAIRGCLALATVLVVI